MESLAPFKSCTLQVGSLMWKRQKKLEGLREELTSINLFERLYDSRANPTESDKEAHLVRQRRKNEVLAEIARLEKRKR